MRACFLSTVAFCLAIGMAVGTYPPGTSALLNSILGANGVDLKHNFHIDAKYPPRPTTTPSTDTTTKTPACVPEMIFNFDDPHNPLREQRNRVWAAGVGNIQIEMDKLVLDGHTYMEIPYFTSHDLRPGYFMSIVICPEGNPHIPRTILSNSFSQKFATLSLVIDGDDVILTVVPRTGTAPHYGRSQTPVQLRLKINRHVCTRVDIEQDDKTIQLTADHQTVIVSGRLPFLTYEPLRIGSGASPNRILRNFIGRVDQFIFDKCPIRVGK